MFVIPADCLDIEVRPLPTSHSGLTLLVSQWHFQAKGSLSYLLHMQALSVQCVWSILKQIYFTTKTFIRDFCMHIYYLAVISERRRAVLTAFIWDVGNPGSALCFGAQIWTRHSRDLKSDLPFPWGSSLTLDYWLSGVPVLVCFFTDKKTGLRLAPRDISWQRILSTKHKLEKQEYHSNPLATSVTFTTPNMESMAQANPTHYQDTVLPS